MELYITLYYLIKYGDISLLKHIIKEIYIILQVSATQKPKYVYKMLRQVHIFDTKAADPIL